MAKNEVVTGLDIGTTKVCALIAEIGEQGEIIITGIGESPSLGMKKGVVVDLEATTRAVEDALGKATRQAGREVESVYVGVTGEHIASLNSSGRIAITNSDREITAADVERVMDASRVIILTPDRQIIHAIPMSFSVDGQNGIRHPVGMSGTRLEVQTHIVHGATTFLQNVEKCIEKAGFEIASDVLEPIATGEAVLLPAERELGVCLLDIGGGTSDLAVFVNGEIFYSGVIPVGGNHVTNDVAYGLTVGHDEAERLKTESGHALIEMINDEDVITVRQVGRDESRKLRRKALVQIIEPRMQELFQMVYEELQRAECLDVVPAGIVISGGGSQLQGCIEIAQQVMKMPVRIGKPRGVGGLGLELTHPRYATAVGLVQYGARQIAQYGKPSRTATDGFLSWLRRFWHSVLERIGV